MAKDGTKAIIGLGLAGAVAAVILLTREAKAAPPPPPPPGYATLYGIVIDAISGKAVSGVSVTLDGYSATTKGAGDYTFANLTPGSYSITLLKEGYEMASRSITLAEGLNELNVALTPVYVPPPAKANLSGQITDATTGRPIEGAKVTLDSQVKYTDVDGIYAFFDLTPGTYNITIEKEGYITYG